MILLRRDGTGNFDWRIPDHQGSGNGYGEAGTLPGLSADLAGAGCLLLSSLTEFRFHDAHKDNGHHGRRGGQTRLLCELGRGEGNGADLR